MQVSLFDTMGVFSFTKGNTPAMSIPATLPLALLGKVRWMSRNGYLVELLILGKTGFR